MKIVFAAVSFRGVRAETVNEDEEDSNTTRVEKHGGGGGQKQMVAVQFSVPPGLRHTRHLLSAA